MPQTQSPGELLLWGQPRVEEQSAAAGAAKPEGQGPDPDSLSLPGHLATNFCQTEVLPTYLYTPGQALEDSDEEVIDLTSAGGQSLPPPSEGGEPRALPKEPHRPS